MNIGDKFYQVVCPLTPIILSCGEDKKETCEFVTDNKGKKRKIGEYYAEEHTATEFYQHKGVYFVLDEDEYEFEVDDVIWSKKKAEEIAEYHNTQEKGEIKQWLERQRKRHKQNF